MQAVMYPEVLVCYQKPGVPHVVSYPDPPRPFNPPREWSGFETRVQHVALNVHTILQ